jgi:hypothetical protein
VSARQTETVVCAGSSAGTGGTTLREACHPRLVRNDACRIIAMLATGALTAFIGAVAVHHVINADLEPVDHVVSEYANAKAGATMTAGFLAWALSLAAMSWIALRDRHTPPAGRWALSAFLALAALGAVLTAAFPTQAVAAVVPAGTPRTAAGRLHDLGSATATLAIVGAATVALRAVTCPAWIRPVTAALLLGAVACSVVLLALDDPVPGVRQRSLLAAGCAWQGALLAALALRSRGFVTDGGARR